MAERPKADRVPTPEEFAAEMRGLDCGDEEIGHQMMDALMVRTLRSLGYGEGCDVFEQSPKWYA